MSELSRREFVIAAAAVCGACGAELSNAAGVAEKVEPVDAGELSKFGKEGIYDQFVTSQKFLLVRKGDLLYAMTALCTHKNFLMAVGSEEKKKEVECSKHGSRFSNEGAVVKGPAKVGLPRYGISLNDQKHVMVNTSKRYEEKQWKDSGSYLRVSRPAE